MKFKFILTILLLFLVRPTSTLSENLDISVYTGTFDVIDKEGDDQTTLIGIEHRNTDLFRNTFFGKFAPVTGAFVTGKDSLYLYTGVEAQYKLGSINFTPSFTPGLYHEGNGKDLGHILEFKSELEFSFDFSTHSQLGFSYNHISNASLGDKNPGANSYMFNFFKNF